LRFTLRRDRACARRVHETGFRRLERLLKPCWPVLVVSSNYTASSKTCPNWRHVYIIPFPCWRGTRVTTRFPLRPKRATKTIVVVELISKHHFFPLPSPSLSFLFFLSFFRFTVPNPAVRRVSCRGIEPRSSPKCFKHLCYKPLGFAFFPSGDDAGRSSRVSFRSKLS
jgi:hypothetical protein